MKKSVNNFIFFLSMATIAGCQKQPSACFDADKTIANVNENISFTSSCSKDSHHCEWNFGDGKTSTDENPTHAFSTSGTYKVSFMTMSKNDKKMDQISKTITIN